MKQVIGDITTVEKGYILQQVNCQGVMGSGVAKAIYTKWPIVRREYLKYCRDKSGVQSSSILGAIQVVRVGEEDDLYVVNMFTQDTYGHVGKHTSYDGLDFALNTFFQYQWRPLPLPVHHPMIGSGLGGGHWPIIAEIIKYRVRTETTLWTLNE